MTTLQDKLDNIYQTKLEIKSAIGTDSDVFSEYPAMIRSMSGGGVSYSYLDERLSYYVETADLEAMGYVTESYVTNAISSIPGVDLSSYVTYTYLESKEYLTEIPSTYATYAAISEMGYITYSYGDSIYVSYAYIGDLNEITEYILGSSSSEAPENVYATKYELGSYVSKDELNNASYATESYVTNAISNIPSVDLSSYVTYTYLESKEYITINDVPTVDTSSYVTYTYLENKEYLSEIPDTYATYAAISEMGYITSNDLPVIDENIIPKENNTYTLGDASYFYGSAYITNLITYSNGNGFYGRGDRQVNIKIANDWRYVFHQNFFGPAFDNQRNCGSSTSRWAATYTTNLYADNIHNFIWTGTSEQYAALSDYTTYQIYLIQEA